MSKDKQVNPKIAKTRGELAQALGVSLQSVQTYVAEGAPGKGPGGYDIDAFIRWRAENKRPLRGPAAGGEKTGDQARLLKAQADEKESKAALAELELQIQRGEFLPIAEVKERDIARIAAVKRGLLAFDRSLPPRLVGLQEKEMQPVIRAMCRELLSRFAQMSKA